MVGVHAQQYGMDQRYNSYQPEYGTDYGMDNYDDKQYYGKDNSYPSKDSSSVTVKKIKCNNINVNLNGFSGNEIGASTTSGLGALTTQAQAEDEGANGVNSGNDGRTSGQDSDSRFVCINNNNIVIEEQPPEQPTPCDLCFAVLSTQAKEEVNNFLAANGLIPIPQTEPSVSIPAGVDTIKELCAFLSAQQITIDAQELGLAELVSFFINLTRDPIAGPSLVTCLVEEARIFNIIT
jgi:hypothetical protein